MASQALKTNILENKTNRKEPPSLGAEDTWISKEKVKKSQRPGLLDEDSEAWAVCISAPLSTANSKSGDERKSTCLSLCLTEPVLRGTQGSSSFSCLLAGATLYLWSVPGSRQPVVFLFFPHFSPLLFWFYIMLDLTGTPAYNLRWWGLDGDWLGSPPGWGGLWLHLLLGGVIVSHASIYLRWGLDTPISQKKKLGINRNYNEQNTLFRHKNKSIGEFIIFNSLSCPPLK